MPETTRVDDSFFSLTGHRIDNTSQLKLFNILQDVDRVTKFMNIFKSYNINDSAQTDILFYDSYEVENDAWWDNISWDVYGTPYLWWLIALMNDIVNPFEELEVGDNVKVLRSEHLHTVLKDIEEIEGL